LMTASIAAAGGVAFLIWTFTYQRRRRATALADASTQRRSTRAADARRRGRLLTFSRRKPHRR
jgi:hypothetical protein